MWKKKRQPRWIDQIEYHLDEARGVWEYPLATFADQRSGEVTPRKVKDLTGVRKLRVPRVLHSVDALRTERTRAAACAAADAATSNALKVALTLFATTLGAFVIGSLGTNDERLAFGTLASSVIFIGGTIIVGMLAVMTGREHRQIAIADHVWAERIRRYDERIGMLGEAHTAQPVTPRSVRQWGFGLRRQQRD